MSDPIPELTPRTDMPVWIDLSTHHDDIISMYVEHGMTPTRIASEITSRGVRVSRGKIMAHLKQFGVLKSIAVTAAQNRLKAMLNFRDDRSCTTCAPEQADTARIQNFRINRPQYDEFLQKQNGQCAICDQTLSLLPTKQIHTDHCHRTGKVRGVLCGRCNVRLSSVEDIEFHARALKYLGRA